MQTARIDKALVPVATDQLVRLGEEFDGGYVVDKRSIAAADILVSLGIGDSWKFEADCLDINPMPLEAFDGNVGTRRYFFRLLRAIAAPPRLKCALHRARVLFSYLGFFRLDRRHHRLLVGRHDPPGQITLAQVLNKHAVGSDKRAFLKIDIEGSEYHLLDTLVEFAPHITGLAIEFHDVEANLSKIIDFVEYFRLNLAHVHCNNYAEIGSGGCPEVIEVSFTQSPADTSHPPELPRALDRPNNPTIEDYRITFA